MINSERIHPTRLQSAREGLDLLDAEQKAAYVKPKLELSTGATSRTFRFRRAHRRAFSAGIKGQLSAYAQSPDVLDTRAVYRVVPAADFATRSKRALDVAGALALLVLFSPIIAAVALLVMLTSEGPVLFRQTRLGENGRHFTCLKFRTMVQDAEHLLHRHDSLRELYKSEFKIKDDPRVTMIGKVLRKTSLDELPQLFNVLRGDMSLVGPRPIVPPEIAKYGVYGDKLLTARPGLTGVWQVCGRSDTTYDERIVMDMFYIDRSNVVMDVQLLGSTVLSVLKCRGAY